MKHSQKSKPRIQGAEGSSSSRRHLLRKFRWTIAGEKAALTKFLTAVDFTDAEERAHAVRRAGVLESGRFGLREVARWALF